MNKLRNFFCSAILLILLLYLTSWIPREAMKQNLLESVSYLQEEGALFYNLIPWMGFLKIDNYVDAILMNIMYQIDGTNRFESLIRTAYYQGDGDVLASLDLAIKENMPANVAYDRYWHGMMVVLRPLFVLFGMVEIRILAGIALSILWILLLRQLWQKGMKVEFLLIGIQILLVSGFMIPFCVEYMDTWFIMLAISILLLRWESKYPKRIPHLFVISGVCTAFFDFLTTETLTVLVPLLLLIAVREHEGRGHSFGAVLRETMGNGILWLLSYGGMWSLKWVLSTVVIGTNRV